MLYPELLTHLKKHPPLTQESLPWWCDLVAILEDPKSTEQEEDDNIATCLWSLNFGWSTIDFYLLGEETYFHPYPLNEGSA